MTTVKIDFETAAIVNVGNVGNVLYLAHTCDHDYVVQKGDPAYTELIEKYPEAEGQSVVLLLEDGMEALYELLKEELGK